MLEIKLKQALTRDWELVETEVMSHFAETVLAEAFSDRRMYAIPQTSVSSLAATFRKLEDCEFLMLLFDVRLTGNTLCTWVLLSELSEWRELVAQLTSIPLCFAVKSRFNIEEYSFGQTTLEQVFIEMAKQQESEDLDSAGASRRFSLMGKSKVRQKGMDLF